MGTRLPAVTLYLLPTTSAYISDGTKLLMFGRTSLLVTSLLNVRALTRTRDIS